MHAYYCRNKLDKRRHMKNIINKPEKIQLLVKRKDLKT